MCLFTCFWQETFSSIRLGVEQGRYYLPIFGLAIG